MYHIPCLLYTSTARILTVCVAVMLLLSAWGLFDFWNWLQNGAGQKTVDILILSLIHIFHQSWRILVKTGENFFNKCSTSIGYIQYTPRFT